MATRSFLFTGIPLLLLLLLLPASPASARLGARSCRGSLFFSDLRLPPFLDNGPFPSSVLSITTSSIGDDTRVSAWIGYRLPSTFDKVTLSGFLSRRLGDPNFLDAFDFERLPEGDNLVIEHASSSVEEPEKQILQTVAVTPRNIERFPWSDSFLPARIWSHNQPEVVREYPVERPRDGLYWFSAVNDLWRIVFGLLLGAACGAAVAAAFSLAWSFFSRESDDEEDIGILYGYQQIPSPKASEKLDTSTTAETKNKA